MNITPENIKNAIKNVSELDDETLIHHWKCASSIADVKNKKLVAPYVSAIEKERKSRRKESTDGHALIDAGGAEE